MRRMHTYNLDQIAADTIREMASNPSLVEYLIPEGANEDDIEVSKYIASKVSEYLCDTSRRIDEENVQKDIKRTIYRKRLDILFQGLGLQYIYGDDFVDALYKDCF